MFKNHIYHRAGVFVAVIALCLGFAKPSLALPASTLVTLHDALLGNARAIASLQADLGGTATADTYACAPLPIGCVLAATYVVGDFNTAAVLNTLAAYSGWGAVAMANVVQQAISGNAPSLALIQALVGGTQMIAPTTLIDSGGGAYSTMSGTPLRHLNFIVSGHNTPIVPGIGSVSLNTLQLALGGDPSALSVFNQVLVSLLVPPSYITVLTTTFVEAAAQTLGAGSPVNAINTITQAKANNAAAIALVKTFAINITTAAMGSLFDADAFTFGEGLDDFLPAPPVHGVCGDANNSVTLTVPTALLCHSGSASAVSGTGILGTDPWRWTCNGILGGTSVSCSSASSSVLATPPGHTSATGVTSRGSSLNNRCGGLAAPLLGAFGFNPCQLAEDFLGLSYAQNYYGGEQISNHMDDMWVNDIEPSLRNMTAQLHAGRIDQTRQMGSSLDAHTLTRSARRVQQEELQSHRDNAPSELTCVAGSHLAPLGESYRFSNALKQGFRKDLLKRASGAPGTPAESSAAADQKVRWEEYCETFHDPDTNNGVSACPNPATPGAIPDGDIDVEGFLMQDTINMQDPDQYKTASALLRHLIQPHVNQKVPASAIDSPVGEEAILKQQHLDSVRNIAAEAVASIIAKRASVPQSVFTSVGNQIRQIRLKAGIPAADISPAPSYNEVMQALTKERFFDPEYFLRMQGDIGQIKQEQTALNAYISLQYQDIYTLQEQINALLSARAALTLNADALPDQVQAAPLSP